MPIGVCTLEDKKAAERDCPGVSVVLLTGDELKFTGRMYHSNVTDPKLHRYRDFNNEAVEREYDLLVRVLCAQREFTETIKQFLPPELQQDTWKALERDLEGMCRRREVLNQWLKRQSVPPQPPV